jgi:hypothetical protein
VLPVKVKYLAYSRFEVFTAVLLKIKIFWEVTPSLESSYWCFKVHTAFTFRVMNSEKNACSYAGHRSLTHAQKKSRKALLKSKP